jgi:hypothetical protein
MKKITQGKLQLNKETLANLAERNLAYAMGGTSTTGPVCSGQGGWSLRDTVCMSGCYCPNGE